MNRLGSEKSPYLLQHAHNPVDWWPWRPEAFELAKTEGRPVFLSVGYSTCHWCHVMARESFEDAGVAALLNRGYVCVKVDREERPDVDAVYMAACQIFTGSGGWPLTVLMTPDQKPFWAGTYLPKSSAYGRMGLTELLETVSRLWEEDRDALLSRGVQAEALLKEHHGAPAAPAEPDRALLSKAAGQFKSGYDPKWGGFGPAPKFPTPHNLLFLMRYSLLEKDAKPLEMALHTLRAMFRGGIFDHIGGGFSRYSTDEKWLAPHFEKMLYDNALLALAYLEAYGITGDGFFKTAAERTLDYVMRELRDGEGGFYCGQDADSDGVEGKYYLFTADEIREVLGGEDGAYFCGWFGVREGGNFEGKNILNLIENPEYAKDSARIRALSDKLYAYRKNRVRLHLDDKALTSWNALMITALARAGWLLEKPEYIQAAKAAQRFIENALTDEKGGLMLRWREGEAAHAGQLDDYAFYACALLELHRRTGEVLYLRRAVRIAEEMTELFSDPGQGGLFLYSKDGEQLISRPKETYDGAVPSGNGAAALVFERLSKLTGEERWREASRLQLRFLAGAAREYPAGHSVTLLALGEALYPSFELVCATPEPRVPGELDALLRETPLPGLTLLLKTPENSAELEICAPFTASYPIPEKGAAYYLCHDGACRPPVFDIAALAELIKPRHD